ncbi:MAG: hypothetical protein JW829_00535 [Pirellulales bacterium]|nr:hypothetical protein [Pirellulales bacterium]
MNCHSEPLSTLRQIELMRDLQRAAKKRAQDEESIQRQYQESILKITQRFEQIQKEIQAEYSKNKAGTETEYRTERNRIVEETDIELQLTEQQYKGACHDVEMKCQKVLQRADKDRKEASWQIMAVFDAEKGEPRRQLDETVLGIRQKNQGIVVIQRDAAAILASRRQWANALVSLDNGSAATQPTVEPSCSGNEPIESLPVPSATASDPQGLDGIDLQEYVASHVSAAQAALIRLHKQRLPRLFEGGTPAGMLFLAWLISCGLCGFLIGWVRWHLWLPAGLALGLVTGAGILAWIFPKARHMARAGYQEVARRIAEAKGAEQAALEAAKTRSEREAAAIIARRDEGLREIHQKYDAIVGQSRAERSAELARIHTDFPAKLKTIAQDRDRQLIEIDEKYPRILAEMAEKQAAEMEQNELEYQRCQQDIAADRDRAFEAMAIAWREAIQRFDTAMDSIHAQCERLFPPWSVDAWQAWKSPTDPPLAIQFGSCQLDLAHVKHAISKDQRLQTRQTFYHLPALMTLTEFPSFVLTVGEEGQGTAIAVMQTIMLRFLTAAPPGKVRFTIFDPLGLGDNFSAFMHLTDYDELLVTSRIWTETGHMENRLADLTEHMENVIQKYLRSEFTTIHDYNEVAGEVAEPFRVLVVANFPANFSDAATRRLSAIMAGGSRCGVYTIVSVDPTAPLPHHFPLDEWTANSVHLDWNSGKFIWRYGPLEQLPLTLDTPPEPQRFREIVRDIGKLAADANRVEIPFGSLAPREQDIWSMQCDRELVVPIGRTGATQWQSVHLGRGTAQHLLIAGKTGSGKSTFLHALITSAALRYEPDQLRFYLIDFKKGVEFKTYANCNLPHASVIAIESEREFGLSVLERLDRELHRRGDLFRKMGVQEIAGFRSADPGTPMPRILLIIDEFQELFVEDDRIAQDASLILDRLVRQGRAFGIHVLLGSQTLAGAYSLARSTLGQMAIRVALQCSENDAHLILSEENSAARLLSRPGEAIYNDQNGLVAGNHPFQVVWLTETERERYAELLHTRYVAMNRPAVEPIIFEGNVPANLANNRHLADLIASRRENGTGSDDSTLGIPGTSQKIHRTPPSPLPRAWLGEAVQIKDPTSATFRRQGGSNLLIVGQRETLALGMMSAALVSLAAHGNRWHFGPGTDSEPEPSRFYILDGTRPESPEADYWNRLAALLPIVIQVGGPRDTQAMIHAVADLASERSKTTNDTGPPVYLFLHNLGRFRNLRRQEDDFSFSSFSSPGIEHPQTTPDKRLRELLREGPIWGIHTIIWADSYNSVQRVFDRASLREIEMRVVMQLSATDSSSLIDTPLASRLGPNRAYLYSEDEGTIEKFRPYSPPSLDWITAMSQGLVSRTTPDR